MLSYGLVGPPMRQKIADPSNNRVKRIDCWKVFKSERLTVLSPARVMALTTRKSESE